MAGGKLPVKVVQARGRKHLTQEEIQTRTKEEIQPITDEIAAPAYLLKKQKKEFDTIAKQLTKLGIMGETDVDALARYIIAKDLYLSATKKMRSREVMSKPIQYGAWADIQDKYFKQCRACANDLGLTITSRCKLVAPAQKDDKPKGNKFASFEKRADVS